MKRVAIYALLDDQKRVRYVGKSEQPRVRFYNHLHRKAWVRSCQILEWVAGDAQWRKRERYWIAYFRETGNELLNQTSGGEGCRGFTLTASARRKISESNRRHPRRPRGWHHTEEAKAKISRGHRGHHRGGWKFSEEACEKISRALKGRVFTPEWRAKLSVAAIARRAREKGER